MFMLGMTLSGGLSDGLNPCMVVASAVLLMLRLLLLRKGMAPGRMMRTFLRSLVIYTALVNIGLGIGVLSQAVTKSLLLSFYQVAAVLCLATAVIFFVDWARLCRGADLRSLPSERLFRSGHGWRESGWLRAGVMLTAALLSAGSTLWPSNYYVAMMANNQIVPGYFWKTAGYMAVYSLALLWMPVGVFWLWSRFSMSARMQRVVYAGVLLSAAITVFFCLGGSERI